MFALHKYQVHETYFSGYLRLLTELYFTLVPGITLKYITLRKGIFGFGLRIEVVNMVFTCALTLIPFNEAAFETFR